jgi:hypothetical protein
MWLSQQGNHLLTHILAMHLMSVGCSDKTVVRQSIINSKQKVQEMVLTYHDVCPDFCREIGHFDLSTTQCPT